jgi:dienelactone hydrolase
VFFLFAGLSGKILLPSPRLFKEYISLQNRNGHRIAAVIYGRKESENRISQPAAVLCHGISCSKELMNTIGLDLAEHGFLVMAFDYGGHGESDKHPVSEEECLADVLCAIEAVKKDRRANPAEIVLIGHSMGAVSSSMAGTVERDIRAVACLGQKGVGNGEYPRNMLQAYCLYDQYHTVPSMKRSLSEITGVEGITPVYSISEIARERFANPGNKALLIIPDGDHSSEVYSVRIIPEIRNWLRLSVGMEPDQGRSGSAWQVYFEFLSVFGVFGTGIFILSGIRERRLARYCALVPGLATFGSCLILSRTHYTEKVSLILTMIYLVFSIGLYCQNRRARGEEEGGLKWLKGFLLVAISFSIGSLLGTIDQIVRNPRYLLWVPVVLSNIMIHRMHFIFNILRADLFGSYTQGLLPRFSFIILLILEPVFPGLVWRPVGWLAGRMQKGITRAHFTFSLATKERKAFIILGILLLVTIGIIIMRWREGLLGLDSLKTAGCVIFRMYLMPLLVLIVLVRLQVWKKVGGQKVGGQTLKKLGVRLYKIIKFIDNDYDICMVFLVWHDRKG